MQIKSSQRPNQYAVAWTLKLFLRELPCGHCPSLFIPLTAVAERNSHLAESDSSSCLCRERLRPSSHTPSSCWSQAVLIRWAVTLRVSQPLGHLGICLVTFRATCLFREGLGRRKSGSYLLSFLLYFWWVSSSSLMLLVLIILRYACCVEESGE